MEYIVVFAIFISSIVILLMITYALRKIIWVFNPIFFLLNYIQWFLYNPTRFLFKNPNSEAGKRFYHFITFSLIAPVYWFTIHLLMTPIRVINSLYFDVLLYWSVMLDDTIRELFMPTLGSYRHEEKKKYIAHWVIAFPYRLIIFISRSFFVLADSFLMFGIATVLPTLTMYHGTKFDGNLTNIAQKGKWLVGNGDHAGSGIYFGIKRSVATHYAPSGESKGILIIRITPTFVRNQVTFAKDTRDLIGRDGKELSRRLKFPYYTIEHWRDSMGGWWEYCLVQPGKAGQYISTWRIWPVAVLKSEDDKIVRLWGGLSHYSLHFSSWVVGVICWVLIFSFSFVL